MPTDFDRLRAEVKELRKELYTLIGRVGRIEERMEEMFDPPAAVRRVVPPSVVGDAAVLGQEIAETRRVVRSAHKSAQGLSRIVSHDDVTQPVAQPPLDKEKP